MYKYTLFFMTVIHVLMVWVTFDEITWHFYFYDEVRLVIIVRLRHEPATDFTCLMII
jgi:hypothetical protein